MVFHGQPYEIVQEKIRVGQKRLGAQRDAGRKNKGLSPGWSSG
jgi:hypothetical protein